MAVGVGHSAGFVNSITVDRDLGTLLLSLAMRRCVRLCALALATPGSTHMLDQFEVSSGWFGLPFCVCLPFGIVGVAFTAVSRRCVAAVGFGSPGFRSNRVPDNRAAQSIWGAEVKSCEPSVGVIYQ